MSAAYHNMLMEHALATFFLVGADGHRVRYSFGVTQQLGGHVCGAFVAENGKHFNLTPAQTAFALSHLGELAQLVTAVNLTGEPRPAA